MSGISCDVSGAELQRQLVIRDLYLQFATARQEAMTAAGRVENARRAVADAERNVSIAIARYRAGEAPIIQTRDAVITPYPNARNATRT